MSDDGPAAFRNNRRLACPFLLANLFDRIHHIIGIFLNGVVRTGIGGRLTAIVVDSQSPSDVEIFEFNPGLIQFGIDARRLSDGILDAANIGDLRAEVEVQHLQAVPHAVFGQRL
jgi:hypothetical protein